MIKWNRNPEMKAYLTEIIPGHHESDIRAMFLEKFGIKLTKGQIKSFKQSNKVRSGTIGGRFEKGAPSWNKGRKLKPEQYEKLARTMFKKGSIPHNTQPIGTEIIRSDGYIKIKVAEPNTWKLKHRLVYEEYYGVKLGQNDTIIFLDGNKENCSIDNLLRMNRRELIRFNAFQRSDNPEINLTAALATKLEAKIREKEKEKNERTES